MKFISVGESGRGRGGDEVVGDLDEGFAEIRFGFGEMPVGPDDWKLDG